MARPKKIVYLIGSMRRGGAEGQLVHLLRHFQSDRYEASLYVLSAEGDLIEPVQLMGVPIRSFDLKRRHGNLDPRTWLQVRRTGVDIAAALERDRADLIHCWLFEANLLGGWAARRAGGVKIVTSRVSLSAFRAGRRWMKWLENKTNDWTDALMVNAEAVREDVLAHERIDPEKIRVIHNGVELNDVAGRSARAELMKELGIEANDADDVRFIACVANLIYYKGHLTLLEAMAETARAFPRCRLLLLGRDGGMKSSILERAAQLGLADSVTLLGSRDDAARVLRACDVVVHPSELEGFSNVILEAMAAGRAIVATTAGGTPEAIDDGVEGLLVPCRDAKALAGALQRLLGDDALRRRMGESARRRVERDFSFERMMRSFETLYAELLD